MKSIKSGANMILAINSRGFLVPLNKRIRMNYSRDDFFISGHFE